MRLEKELQLKKGQPGGLICIRIKLKQINEKTDTGYNLGKENIIL